VADVCLSYHGIQSVNITQMPRMPTDYKNFMGSVGRNPTRFWRLAAVGYVAWRRCRSGSSCSANPALRELFELRLAYNVAPAADGMGVTVIPALSAQSAQHVVLRFKQPARATRSSPARRPATTRRRCAASPIPRRRRSRKVLLAPEGATNVAAADRSRRDGPGRVARLSPRQLPPQDDRAHNPRCCGSRKNSILTGRRGWTAGPCLRCAWTIFSKACLFRPARTTCS